MPALDITAIRRDFPVTDEMVFLNSAFTSPSPAIVEEAAREFTVRKNRLAPDSLGDWLKAKEDLRAAFARIINASTDEIAVATCSTDGTNLFASSITRIEPKDNVVLSDLDYPSNTIVWSHYQRARRLENRVVTSHDGLIPRDAFERAVDDDTRLIMVALVSHRNGYHHDMAELSELARSHGALLAVDATQAVGSVPVDVRAMGIDFLTCSTYKWLLGPLGLAFIFVRKELHGSVPPLMHGWAQVQGYVLPQTGQARHSEDHSHHGPHEALHIDARKYEVGTVNFQGVYEMQAALDYTERLGRAAILDRLQALGQRLQRGLIDAGVPLFTPFGNPSPIVSFYPGNVEELGRRLAGEHIAVTTRPPYIRVSPHFYNTEEEVDLLVDEVRNHTSITRNLSGPGERP